ncbi:MAG: DUF3604 domain-containing protein [Candidatus Binatia bacterium]|nr:DUF3604 domain-containing protein [Candidatus Binatia bacterium]
MVPADFSAHRGHLARLALFLCLLIVPVGCVLIPENPGSEEWSPPGDPAVAQPLLAREPCANHDPLRQPLYGDLHVHTAYSMDARIRETLLTPDDAYRYATGRPVDIMPTGDNGLSRRQIRIDRPLDFAAVTDHAEWMGEIKICLDPRSAAYDTHSCRIFRGEEDSWLAWLFGVTGSHSRIVGVVGIGGRNSEVCGPDSKECRAATKSVWDDTRESAERFYDRSAACEFTTFPAWEYSRSPGRSKIHRNVIFRNEIVPELPISWIDTQTEQELWQRLRERCLDPQVGCDVLSIPHNPNLSNGNMFNVWYRDRPIEEQREQAALRASMEPLVEMMQVKGESECANGMHGVLGGTDEFCDFEKVRGIGPNAPEDCVEDTGKGALKGAGCQSRLDFVRYALIEGLREGKRIGVNPFKFGFIGSTDTHNGNPGGISEAGYPGSGGVEDMTAALRLSSAPAGTPQNRKEVSRNPGGLAGVWAEENSRDSLFDGMRRRETFATSGPRIAPRFFGGWDLPSDLCDREDLVEQGYAIGVPMGSDLPERVGHGAPTFAVIAAHDAGTPEQPGGLLQRAQIVKGWVGPHGRFYQAVYDVAGTADNGAAVDLATCETSGPGYASLCGVWRDPDFDAEQAAVYYARVIENPTCRWSWRQCLEFAADDRPAGCTDDTIPQVIHERAWTSPIWFEPPAASSSSLERSRSGSVSRSQSVRVSVTASPAVQFRINCFTRDARPRGCPGPDSRMAST